MGADADRALSLFFELYESLPRQGPGSEQATRRALSLLPDLPSDPVIADMGCGSGASSWPLASVTGGTVLALDLRAAMLRRAARAGGGDRAGRVLPILADMAAPPLRPGSLDLLWSEGAIYLVGFARGLGLWRPLLKAGGLFAVTEVTWLTDAPPDDLRRFWATAYPAMTSIAANRWTIAQSGFEPLGHFVLPPECWLENYYAPLEAALGPFLSRHPDDAQAAAVAAEARAEIDLYRRYGDSYGYVFYLARAAE